jgi:hypothetical protein
MCTVWSSPQEIDISTPSTKRSPISVRGGPRLGQAAEFVVVGQRQQFHAVGLRAPHHLRRRKQPVGHGRMAVQIGIERLHAAKNSSISAATRCGWS